MEKTKISIIMVNFNGLKYLKRTIPPVLELDYPNFEFLVVDNGSTDGSIEFIKKFKDIKLLKSPVKASKNHACNYAVKEAKGEYVLLIDNDILLHEKNILKEFEKLKNPKKIIQPIIVNEGEKDTYFYGLFFTFYGPSIKKRKLKVQDILQSKNEEVDIGAPQAAINFFNRDTWLKIGGYDEIQKFGLDDYDIGPRAWVMGLECKLYTKAYVLHLGIKNREERDVLVSRTKLSFSGLSISMFKNYSFFSLIKIFPFFCIIQFIQSLRHSFLKKNIKIFFSFLYSVFFFLRNLPYIFKKRREIQSKRVVKKDVFLKNNTIISNILNSNNTIGG